MNVLVYTGPEVVQASLNGALSSLKSILQPHYTVQTVTQQALSFQPWTASCSLLVLPQCRIPFRSKAVSAIQAFVENGGAFLGLSTGAIYSLNGLDPEVTSMLPTGGVSAEPLLRFRHMMKSGYLYPTYTLDDSESQPTRQAAVSANGIKATLLDASKKAFLQIDRLDETATILATYDGDDVETGGCAGLLYGLGKGKVALWGPALEYPLKTSFGSGATEQARDSLLRYSLSKLLLQVPSPKSQEITHPHPQFLMGLPSRPGVVSAILNSLSISQPLSDSTAFKDVNDTFHFHSAKDSDSVVQAAISAFKGVSDPGSWQPKHVIVCSDGDLPPQELTPLFNCATFFTALNAARERDGVTSSSDPWGIGDAFFYSKAVTSTQTLLDKNPQFLSALPTPIVSMASYQLAGRGRGANIWLSPSGCLQFSVLLRISLAAFPASKLVFVQYLFALAVAEACRDESVLGPVGESVKLKWPNDIYAVTGDGKDSKKKVGGILVNTSFSDGNVDVVIGCGVNVLNSPPITSLVQLIGEGDTRELTMEKTLASVLSKFERMWTEFIRCNGSFEPFMDLYLSRWLHSDQVVMVTTLDPPRRVRIAGITPDHGLLRTIPESDGYSTHRGQFIDLQPDGNSFDLMAGMIKTKA